MGWTGHPTGGCIELFNCKGTWDGLRVGLVYRFAISQLHVVFIRSISRAYFLAVAAGRTFIWIYITGPLTDGYFKISNFSIDILDIRTGMEFDVGMPADLDQFG